MTLVLILLAIPGVLAVLLRLFTALFGLTKHTIERYVAGQISDQHAERGDLTSLAAAEKVRGTATRMQLRHLIEALGWGTLLALPLLVPATVILYPFYAIVWLLPHRMPAP